MDKVTDLTIATQLSTVFAAICTYVAHLIESGAILNANWHFAIYVLLVIAVSFMLFPHLVNNKTAEHIVTDHLDALEAAIGEAVPHQRDFAKASHIINAYPDVTADDVVNIYNRVK